MPSDSPSSTGGEGGGRATKRDGPPKPVRMGRYEIVKHIATGGMGKVFRARDLETGRDVALKILDREAASKPAMVVRFEREVRSAMKLDHENVVRVFDAGEAGGHHFMAMEFIDGIDLHDYVKRKGPLDPEEARQIVLQAARALQHAADLDVVHRDVKPSNFLLARKDGRPLVKLTDFGLAREVSADEFRVTRAGTTVGTVDYMSPEQARDSSAADARSDLYSLGSTWFHLLTGQAPFPDGGLGERLIKIMTELPPDARELNDRVSDDTWAILSKLLEKDPDDRYRSAEDLIEALVGLEGTAVARAKPTKKARKKPRRTRPDEDTAADADAPATTADGRASRLPYFVGGGLALLAVLAVMTFFFWPRKPRADAGPVVEVPVPPPAVVKEKDKGGVLPEPDKDRVLVSKDKLPPVKVPEPKWPALYKPAEPIDAAALRREVSKPFAATPLPDPFVAVVSRLGEANAFRTLGEAAAAAPAGRALVIEIRDDGPLFELGFAVPDRPLTLRAGKGHRPLVLWDVAAAVERRPKDKKEPLAFVAAGKGLTLEGLEVAVRWPAGLTEAGTLFDVTGDLSVSGCTVSTAGKPPEGVTLARVSGAAPRCHFARLHARGQALTALALDGAADVLFDGCLVQGGTATLIHTKGTAATGPAVRLVSSTMLGRGLIEHRSAGVDVDPVLKVLCWDALLCGTGDEGDLLTLAAGLRPDNVEWRAVNAAYVGWRELLAGPTSIPAKDPAVWRARWGRREGDDAVPGPWPEQQAAEPGTSAASGYAPTKAVAFAATASDARPLGCDLPALSPCRDAWVTVALEPNVAPVEALASAAPPEIPPADDGLYHGGRFDLAGIDLGVELAKKLAATKPGPRVVLRLKGKGDATTSPLRLKGANLVVHFEEPADEKAARPTLRLAAGAAGALIEVEGGGVDVINGGLKVADGAKERAPHLIRVSGGDVRLYRTRLEGPTTATPTAWASAVWLAGSGEASPDKAFACSVSDSVILSSKAGVVLEGVGQRLLLRNAVVVAGTDAVVVRPGEGCVGRPNAQCEMLRSTVAARSAVLRLGDAPRATEAVVVQSRDCAFLNPFPSAKAGLLACEGKAMSRGLLLWQGERDAVDVRMWFGARAAEGPVPERRDVAAWRRLWGSGGVRSPRAEVGFMQAFGAKWELDRLTIRQPEPPGANVRELLGKR